MIIDKSIFPKTKLKFCAKVYGGSTPKSDEAEFWDGEIVWVTPADLSKRSSNHIVSSKRMITNSGLKSCSTVLVPKNSIVLSTRAPIGSIGIAAKELCTNQGCKSIVCNTLHHKFLFFCLEVSTKELNELGTGTTFLELSTDSLINFQIPFPNFDQQRQIAAYLNRETAKIDKLIAKQQKLIKLLQEKRQAVISQAVTKGLDLDVKMKDSGVEWLGDVPEHWDIKKVSLLFRCRKGTNAAVLTKEFCSTIEGPFPVYSGQTSNNGVMASINTYEFDAGPEGVLFSTTVGAKAMTVMHIMGKFSLSQNCMIIAPIKNALVRYYFYAFQPLFRFERGLIPEHMQASFRMEDLYGYRIPCPPDVEMTAIVNMLEVFNAKTEQLIDKAKNSINLLTEHRQALITAAVTGKIDVRGLVTDEEVAALDADPVLETTEEDFESEVAEADYITEQE